MNDIWSAISPHSARCNWNIVIHVIRTAVHIMVPIPDNITSAQTEVRTIVIPWTIKNDMQISKEVYSKILIIKISEKLFSVIRTIFSLNKFSFWLKLSYYNIMCSFCSLANLRLFNYKNQINDSIKELQFTHFSPHVTDCQTH